MEASTIFDAAEEVSPGDRKKLLHGSRKTIAWALAINHRQEAGNIELRTYLPVLHYGQQPFKESRFQ